MVSVTCEKCGKLFFVRPSRVSGMRFCSPECGGRSDIKRVSRICKICGIEFMADPSQIKRGKANYCSRDCYKIGKTTSKTYKCLQCNKEFKAQLYRDWQVKYCSKKCYIAATKINNITKKCTWCGKETNLAPSVIKWNGGIYCSRKCHYEAITGENSPNWLGGKSFEPYCTAFNHTLKESIRKKFGRTCYLCPTTEEENEKKLAVHHVDYNKSQGCKGMRWSLIPLCRKCHPRTNMNRWYWFALLRDYWLYDHINFAVVWTLI